MCESCSRGLCSSGLRSSDRNCKGGAFQVQQYSIFHNQEQLLASRHELGMVL